MQKNVSVGYCQKQFFPQNAVYGEKKLLRPQEMLNFGSIENKFQIKFCFIFGDRVEETVPNP